MKPASGHPGVIVAARLLHLTVEELQLQFERLHAGSTSGVHPSLVREWEDYLVWHERHRVRVRGKRAKDGSMRNPYVSLAGAQRTVCERIRMRHRIYVCPVCKEAHAAYRDGVMRPHVSGAPTGQVRRACPGSAQRAEITLLTEGPRYATRARDLEDV